MREGFKAGRSAVAACLVAVSALSCQADTAGKASAAGRPGEAIHLVVGYQPYYTEAWSGVVIRGLDLYRKYLPAGSTVEFHVGLKGATILVDALRAGEVDAAYLGLAPAAVAIGDLAAGDLRAIAVTGLGYDQCNILVTRPDAPGFHDAAAALHWLDGRRMAIPSGTCSDLFARRLFEAHKVKPRVILDQNIDVIGQSFESGALDAAALWEPAASRLIDSGLARRLLTGAAFDLPSAGFLVVRAELVEQRPDIVHAWLEAELDAQLALADPARRTELIDLVEEQTTGYSTTQLQHALFGPYGKDDGGTDPRLVYPFAFTPQTTALLEGAAAWLLKEHPSGALRPGAIEAAPADALIRERGLSAPVGTISADRIAAREGAT